MSYIDDDYEHRLNVWLYILYNYLEPLNANRIPEPTPSFDTAYKPTQYMENNMNSKRLGNLIYYGRYIIKWSLPAANKYLYNPYR